MENTEYKLSGFEVLAVIFAFADVAEFPADKRFIQNFIREKKPEFEKLLPFVFSENVDIYPFSRSLDEAMTLLQMGGVIIIIMKQPAIFRISQELRKKYIIKAGETLNSEEITKIRNLAYKFARAAEEAMMNFARDI